MQDDFRSRFADTLRRLRTEAGWTQEEVAQKLYVSDKTVSKWERGQSLPDALMSVGIGLVIGMMTAAFFLANEAMIAQKPLNFLLMIGLILSVIPITIVCVALGARIIRRERAEQRKSQ